MSLSEETKVLFKWLRIYESHICYLLDGEKLSRGFQVWSFANTRDLFFWQFKYLTTVIIIIITTNIIIDFVKYFELHFL